MPAISRPITRAGSGAPASRAGFTLLEMLIVIILFGLVMGSMMLVIRRQQAFYRSAGQMMELRSQAGQALGILPRDLRAISSIGGDITEMSDDQIGFRSQTGSAVVCSFAGSTVVVPPHARLMKGARLTVWREQPVAGDVMMIYDDGDQPSEVDDLWRAYTISGAAKGAVNSANACAPSTGFVTAADTADSWRFTATAAISTTIRQGAPVRFARTTRYSLYEAADDEWYVGFEENVGGAWSTIGPVSGPHRAYSADEGESGLTFVYYDQNGTELDPTNMANAPNVARIDVTVRGRTKNDVVIAGKTKEQVVDSLYASVNLRNRQ
jgi:prepilin-type N-terminal cleavage/methylation domain-containing protein